jgi:hypothetical protein
VSVVGGTLLQFGYSEVSTHWSDFRYESVLSFYVGRTVHSSVRLCVNLFPLPLISIRESVHVFIKFDVYVLPFEGTPDLPLLICYCR